MFNDKFLKILWTINGILILIYILYNAYSEIRNQLFYRYGYEPSEIIVGKPFEDAKKEGLELQGIDYNEVIYLKKSGGYILPIKIKTYEIPKVVAKELAESAGDISPNVGTRTEVINIIFMDATMEKTWSLLDRKGFIQSFKYPGYEENDYYLNKTRISDPTVENLVYNIGYDDSNKDGFINSDDDADLYITDLKGENFTKITSEVDVYEYNFLNANEILILYVKRLNQPEEYKRRFFAKYYIREMKYVELDDLQKSLDKIESILTK